MIFVFLFLTSLCMTICRSIHIIANGINSSFLWLSNVPLYIHATFLYPFISPWAFRLLPCPGCVNCAAMNIGVLVSFRIMVFPRYSLGVGLLGHMVALFLVFLGTSRLFSEVAVPICLPTNSAGKFHFLHTLSSIYCLQIC